MSQARSGDSRVRWIDRLMFRRSVLIKSLSATGEDAATRRRRRRLVRTVMKQGFGREMDGRVVGLSRDVVEGTLVDMLFAGPGDPRLPDEIFWRLRWGGVFVYAGTDRSVVRRLSESFNGKRGFILERKATVLQNGLFGLRVPGVSTRGHYFVARKTRLIQPGDVTDRFTYHVELAPWSKAEYGYVVCKQVPSYTELVQRLRKKFPEAEQADLEKRARKLVEHIFPTFLTREAAMLQVLQRDLPEPYRSRVPRALKVEKDERGFVRRLIMNWLRIGGEPMSQLEFARQSAELLAALHDKARVMHLDLRLDNFVISDSGVCFVDFGSSVRFDENLKQSPMLDMLFGEMMRTSHIQRMLGRMLDKGYVTSQIMADVHQKVDKTVDTFYLAVQIAKPHDNPDFRYLVTVDKKGPEARALAALIAAVLRPKHPERAEFKTASDILRGIRRINRKFARRAA